MYRYALWRSWGSPDFSRHVVFIGLNPSTADATENDPTVRRCIGFSRDWGYDGLIMLNAYAYRSTDPRGLKQVDDPVGPENDQRIGEFTADAALIIAAWGVHCQPEREQAVCQAIGKPIHCLGTTKEGRPKHPLYLKASSQPVPFNAVV